MKIQFLGAAETVTGSKYLLEANSGQRILIDCGMFQGLKKLRMRNWEKLIVSEASIQAVILTHAHLDHSGYIPKLVRDGFKGDIFSTSPTKALAQILLKDSAHIQEEEAAYANRKNFSKHKPALALYTKEDAKKSLSMFKTKAIHEEFNVGDFTIKFYEAGHILGATSVLVKADGNSILFSGDLGRPHDFLMSAPSAPPEADYIVMESTYGDKLHGKEDTIEEMSKLVKEIKEKKSVLMIPSFSVGRVQDLLYCLYQVFKNQPELRMPLFVNSPMATKVTELYSLFYEEHILDKETCDEVCSVARFVETMNESKKLNQSKGPMIIIAGSGMLTGGRILHHLTAFGDNTNNVILLVGFQAEGTRGADLVKGERRIKFFGHYHNIKAKLLKFDFFSAHADQAELISWLGSAAKKPKKVFLSHGEAAAADVLRRKINEELSLEATVAQDGMSILL